MGFACAICDYLNVFTGPEDEQAGLYREMRERLMNFSTMKKWFTGSRPAPYCGA